MRQPGTPSSTVDVRERSGGAADSRLPPVLGLSQRGSCWAEPAWCRACSAVKPGAVGPGRLQAATRRDAQAPPRRSRQRVLPRDPPAAGRVVREQGLLPASEPLRVRLRVPGIALRRGSPTSHGALAPLTFAFDGAAHEVSLDGRAALFDLMAPVARDQRHLQPFTGAAGAGERDLTRGLASRTQ